MPLTFASLNEINLIKSVKGNDAIKRHLENLGFVSGSEVIIVNKTQDNFIVNIKGSRIAISAELANKIIV